MAEGYTYKGYGIQAEEYRVKSVGARTGWNICKDGEAVKRNFSTVETAKHYIDAVLRKTPARAEPQNSSSGESE